MAKAGDGEARSERRQLMKTVSLRISGAEKHRFQRLAQLGGYPSLTAWALDRMRSDPGDVHGAGARARRILCGKLGHLGGQLTALAEAPETLSPEQLRRDLADLTGGILALQRAIMKGGENAGESDPQPGS